MKAKITIGGNSYEVGQMVNKSFLDENEFKKVSVYNRIEDYAKGNEKLILEVFEDGIFKITGIDDYVPPVKKTNLGNN